MSRIDALLRFPDSISDSPCTALPFPQSNPCVEPIFDEIIEAPTRFKVKRNGRVNEIANLHIMPQEAASRTIGAIRNHVSPGRLEGLFNSSTGNSQATLEEMEQQLSVEVSQQEGEEEDMGITASILI